MQANQFFPTRTLSFQADAQFKPMYEGVKATFEADLAVVEKCFGKCNVGLSDQSFSAGESGCMKKCFVKYLDSALLVEKEFSLYTHGHPIL